jgi:hypothetical protein
MLQLVLVELVTRPDGPNTNNKYYWPGLYHTSTSFGIIGQIRESCHTYVMQTRTLGG